MSDHFTRDLFAWLRQVATDHELPPLSARIAIVISQYINRKTGTAWPTQETLARDLGITNRSIRQNVGALVERGHLNVEMPRGRHRPNVYRLILKKRNGASGLDEEKRNGASGIQSEKPERPFRSLDAENRNGHAEKPESPFQKTGTTVPAEPSEEPSEEPIEGKHTTKRVESRSRRRRIQTPWPDGFYLNDDLANHAADKAGWSHGRAFAEFERFENYHRSKGGMFADWIAAWRTWVSNGVRYDRERSQQQAGALVIDEAGNPVNAPPPRQAKGGFRRRSNTDVAFDGGDFDY